MAATQQKIDIKMSRFDNAPWGFRVHGGIDFGSPLTIQKVNLRSPGEAAGLQAGDVILKVNGQDISLLRHKEAQEAIKRAGNNFMLSVKRSENVAQPPQPKPAPQNNNWDATLNANKPAQADNAEDFTKQFMKDMFGGGQNQPQKFKPEVTPVGQMPTGPTNPNQTFTKTSLAANKQEDSHWDVKHNQAAKGFNASQSKVNGNTSQNSPKPAGKLGPALPTKQYNSPKNMYSDSAIQEIMEQQAEVLAGGVKGINFKQYEPQPNEALYQSEVLKALHEQENATAGVAGLPEYQEDRRSQVQGYMSQGRTASPKLPTQPTSQQVLTRQSQQSPQQMQRIPQAAFQPKPTNNSNWNETLNKDKAGQANNAEDFTKQFMSQMYPGQTQQIQQPNLQQKPTNQQQQNHKMQQNSLPKQTPTQQQNWNKTLSEDRAGQASNAEDFTKQFMSQMYGGQSQQNQQQSNGNSIIKIPNPEQQRWNETRNDAGIKNQFLSSMYGKPTIPSQQPPVQQTIQTPQQSTFQQKPTQGINSNSSVGGAFQWPPPKEDVGQPAGPSVFLDPNQNSQQNVQQTQQTYQQNMQSNQQSQQQTQQQSYSYQQQSSTQQSFQQTTQQKPVSILKQTQPSQPSESSLRPQQNMQQESYSPGPGQQVTAPRRGKGELKQQQPGMRTPICGACDDQIRGPFITAMGKTWCPGCFTCSQATCQCSLQEVGFVEEKGHLYCEDCYGKYLAPVCEKCRKKILGNCLKAMGKTFHPECFVCAYCGKIFGNAPFYLEDGLPYCEEDWNELFTTKCVSCGFPIEAGDRWVEALNNNYHSQCFNCTLCKKNLEGKGFFVKAGKPFCKSHARMGI